MSNTLCITVTRFTDVGSGQSEFGFVATDSDSEYFERGYATLADFLAAYPNEDALVAHVRNQARFFPASEMHVVCSFPSDAQRLSVKPPSDVVLTAARLRDAIYGNRAIEAILLQDRYKQLSGEYLPDTLQPGESFEHWAKKLLDGLPARSHAAAAAPESESFMEGMRP